MQPTSEIKACVERLGSALNDIRRSATERETAAKSVLDTEKPALQTNISINRARLKLLRDLMHKWEQEQEAASKRLAELESGYDAAVQQRHEVSALPDTQKLVDFVHTWVSSSSRRGSPAPPPAAQYSPASREDGADPLSDRSVQPGSLAVSSRKRPAEEEPEISRKRPCSRSLAMKTSNTSADANETDDVGTARCEVETPGCDEVDAKTRMGGSRKAPGNGEPSAAGDHDAVHQLTGDISVAEEPAAAYSKGCTSLSDMSKKTITSSKPTSTLDDIASPHDEVANVACILQTGSRRHPGSREIQLRSIPASAAGISLLVAECRHGSEDPAPRVGQKLAEHDAILYRQNGGTEVNLASQDDNTSDAQHAPGHGSTQTRPSPSPSASDAGRHFNALQSPGPLSATLPRSDGRNGCGDDSSSNDIGCAADFAHQTALRSRQPPAPPNARPNQEGYLRYLVDRHSHAKGHGMWYLITRDFNQHYSCKMSLEALQMIRSRDRNHRQTKRLLPNVPTSTSV